MTFLEKLDRLPPFKVRLMARMPGTRSVASTPWLVEQSGLDRKTIHKLARAESWAAFEARIIDAFTSACGVNLLVAHKHLEFLSRTAEAERGMDYAIRQSRQRKYLQAVGAGIKDWRKK